MKLNILNPKAEKVGTIDVPAQLSEAVRPDLIKRAFEANRANARQPYGSDPRAGKRASAKLSRRRRKYRGGYGRGASRVQRKIMLRRGTQFSMVGAFVPGTVGGRRAHPPKAQKDWSQKINRKERRKALRSALSATLSTDPVKERGHAVPKDYPFALSQDFETLSKTKDILEAFEKIGLSDELKRCGRKHVRAGKGKLRGRKYKRAKGPLLVVSASCALTKSARNIGGVDIAPVKKLSAELLAPGSTPGRLTLFTKPALQKLAEGLYA